MIHRILLTVILEFVYLSATLCSYTEGTNELSELGAVTVCVCVLNGGKEGHSALPLQGIPGEVVSSRSLASLI